jgi:dihydroorotase
MSTLIKSALILDEKSTDHNKRRNILLADSGIIKYIGPDTPEARRTIEGKNLMVSPGWMDMRASICDPGYEHKEDQWTLRAAAEAGGFTQVAVLPNTKPVIGSKNEVGYLLAGNNAHAVQVHPYGAVTVDCAGEELTEMHDMHQAGAVGFTDGDNAIWNTDILLKSLLYLQKFNALLINKPEDKYLVAFGTMNEGLTSTGLGLKGMPKLAEEVMIKRDLEILEYAGGRLHFSNISSAKSVEMIRQAKKAGLQVTCDVALYSIIWTDEMLEDFDTNFKVNPPLREPEDVDALRQGLKDGTIDVLVSAHNPQDEESKKLEFDHAEFGMIGLQTFFAMLVQQVGKKALKHYLPLFTSAPREVLNMPVPSVTVGEKANLTVFDPDAQWIFDGASNRSKSDNSPLVGEKLTGRVVAVFNAGRSYVASK